MSLKKIAISGLKWSALAQIVRQVSQIITTIILANLLNPADFGLMGMATIVTVFLEIFKDLGTSAAIIQKQDESDSFLSTIFWLNIFLGFLFGGLIFLASPLIASFYNDIRLTAILRVLSIGFIISSFSLVQKSLLEKQLKIARLSKIEITTILFSSIAGIIAAFLGANVWSLVIQSLINVILFTLLLWLFKIWTPRLMFEWKKLDSVRSFSLNLVGFRIFDYISMNADNILIGKFLGATELGYYSLAYRIMLYPLQNIAWVINRVTFPVFSQMQDDNARFRHAYLRIVASIALITFPLMLGLWGLAQPFVLAVFGTQWSPIILLVLLLSPVGMLQSIGSTVGIIYQAKGRTDWFFKWGLFAGVYRFICFAIGLQWGLLGMTLAYVISSLSLSYHNFSIPFKLIEMSMIRFLQVLWKTLLCGLAMLVILLVIKANLPSGLNPLFILAINIPIGAISYLGFSWLINREKLQELFLSVLRPLS